MLLKFKLELDIGEDKGYKIEVMKNNTVYITKAIRDQLLRLYYLISWKSYSKDENI